MESESTTISTNINSMHKTDMTIQQKEKERVHTTIRFHQFTLQFDDEALEIAYQARVHTRKKALWLRSLIPAAGSHILFGLGDCLEHPPEHLLITMPARVFLAVLQIAMFILVRWNLIRTNEKTMLLVSICNGIPTLCLYALQRSSLQQWDALFVVFGLSFYTIPKITPLGFAASLIGSWATAICYAILSVLIRPPSRAIESLLGFLYCAPVIGIFNTISYYSEYNSRERFILRRRLQQENISLALARSDLSLSQFTSYANDRNKDIQCPSPSIKAQGNPTTLQAMQDSLSRSIKFRSPMAINATTTYYVGVSIWAALTMGAWASIPDTFKFVDNETGWAWFSHCAGVTMFLVVITRKLEYLFVVPFFSSVLLFVISKTGVPASWIIISAHSVGYSLLLASLVVALGVVRWFIVAWKQLVAFLTRSCFLYPQLQEGLEKEFPMLEKIVSEYTAALDPDVLSARKINQSRVDYRLENQQEWLSPSSNAKELAGIDYKHSHNQNNSFSQDTKGKQLIRCRKNSMMSVLPSLKPGKCFFCSQHSAEHFIPACSTWGKWTHWRMEQQDALAQSASSGDSLTTINRSVSAKVTTQSNRLHGMCTSYASLQIRNGELEAAFAELLKTNEILKQNAEKHKVEGEKTLMANVELQKHMQIEKKKLQEELRKKDAEWQGKVNEAIKEMNSTISASVQNEKELKKRWIYQQKECTSLKDELHLLKISLFEIDQLKAEVEKWKGKVGELETQIKNNTNSHNHCEMNQSIQSLPLARRLPYARSLEIEGLRESIRHGYSNSEKDFSQMLHWNESFKP